MTATHMMAIILAIVIANILYGVLRGVINRPSRQMETRLREVERRLDLLMQPHGIPPIPTDAPPVDYAAPPALSPAVTPALRQLIREKKLIPAIKLYRELHPGVDLKDARDAVERLSEE